MLVLWKDGVSRIQTNKPTSTNSNNRTTSSSWGLRVESFEPFLMTLAANYLLLCSCCGLPRAGRPGICPLLPHPSKSCDLKIAHKKGYLVPHSWCVFSLFISPLLSNLKNILKSTGGEKRLCADPSQWVFSLNSSRMAPSQAALVKIAPVAPAGSATGNSCLQACCLTH